MIVRAGHLPVRSGLFYPVLDITPREPLLWPTFSSQPWFTSTGENSRIEIPFLESLPASVGELVWKTKMEHFSKRPDRLVREAVGKVLSVNARFFQKIWRKKLKSFFDPVLAKTTYR